MCLYCLLQLIHGLSYVAQVFLLQRFYDSITAYDSAADKYGIVVNLLLIGFVFSAGTDHEWRGKQLRADSKRGAAKGIERDFIQKNSADGFRGI